MLPLAGEETYGREIKLSLILFNTHCPLWFNLFFNFQGCEVDAETQPPFLSSILLSHLSFKFVVNFNTGTCINLI